MIDIVYCWECKRFSFAERDTTATCQHVGCTSVRLGDVGDVQRELIYLAEHSRIEELVEFAPRVQEMFKLNGTPAEKRKIGIAQLHKPFKGWNYV